MRRASLVLVFACVGCSPWRFPEPPSRLAPPADALGQQLPTEGGLLRTFGFRLGTSANRAIVMVEEGPGYDSKLERVTTTTTHWYSVDAKGQRKDLAAPPAALNHFWPSQQPDTVLASSGGRLFTLSGDDAWSEVAQSTPLTALPDFATMMADGRVFARTGSKASVLVNGTWHHLSDALNLGTTGVLVFGPASQDGVRLVWLDVNTHDVCTQVFDTTTLFAPRGPKNCKQAGPQLPGLAWLGDAFNGTIDDFQVVFDVTDHDVLWHFSENTWHRGYIVVARSTPTVFGSLDTFLSTSQAGQAGGVYRMVKGQGAGIAYQPPYNLFEGCTLPACNPKGGAFALASDLSAAWYLTVNEADAKRTVFLKRVSTTPEPETCLPACTEVQMCLRTTATTTSCVSDGSKLGVSTDIPATARLQFATAQGPAYPVITLTNPDSGIIITPATRVEGLVEVVELPPSTPIILNAELPGYPRLHVPFTTQIDGVQTDLGSFSFSRGIVLGRAVNSQAPALVGNAFYVPVASVDGGSSIVRVQDASDGGVEVVSGFEGQVDTAVWSSPDGHWLLLESGTRLEVVDLTTSARAAVVNSVLNEGWSTPHFSRDGHGVAIERASGISVVSLSGTAPTERFEVHGTDSANRATFVQLSRDATVLLAHLNTGWVAATATAQVPLGAAGSDAILSGDGAFVYLATTLGSGNTSSLSVRSTGSSGAFVQFATGATAFAADLDGADLLFTTPTGTGRSQVSRYVASAGLVAQVAQLQGQAGASPHAGALWVDNGQGHFNLFFPCSLATPRVVSGNAPTTLGGSVDWLGRLQSISTNATRIYSETSEQLVARGPGVFRPDASRRLNSIGFTLDTVSGTGIASTTAWTPSSAGLNISPVFTRENPMNSLGFPCALHSFPLRTLAVDSVRGVATWTPAGTELRCVR